MDADREFEAMRARRQRAFGALEFALKKNVLDWGFASAALLEPTDRTSDGTAFLKAAAKRGIWHAGDVSTMHGAFVAWGLKKPAKLIDEYLAQHPPDKYGQAEEAYLARCQLAADLEHARRQAASLESEDARRTTLCLMERLSPIPEPPEGWRICLKCNGGCSAVPSRWISYGPWTIALCASSGCLVAAASKSPMLEAMIKLGRHRPLDCNGRMIYEFVCQADGCKKTISSCCTLHAVRDLSAHLPHPPKSERCGVSGCFERWKLCGECPRCDALIRTCFEHRNDAKHACEPVSEDNRCACYATTLRCRREARGFVACPLGCGSKEPSCAKHALGSFCDRIDGMVWWAHQPFCLEVAVSIKRKELQRLEGLAEKADKTWLCTICMDAARSCVALPCSHAFGCGPCSQKVAACPICRREIASFIPVYSA